MTEHDIINIITITVSLISLIILLYFYPKIKSATKTYNDANEIVNLIIKELRERLNTQDLKISDITIKSEIIENKLINIIKENNIQKDKLLNKNNINIKSQNKISKESNILSQKSQKITPLNNEILTNTENIVLNNLRNAELTATQIQEIINKSREHTSRILKKLFDNKLIIRNNTRPYTYKINN